MCELAVANSLAAVGAGVDALAHSVRDEAVDAALITAMREGNVGYIPTLTRELSVFTYESTPEFFSDPFFLRGISLYQDQVDVVSDPGMGTTVRVRLPVEQSFPVQVG